MHQHLKNCYRSFAKIQGIEWIGNIGLMRIINLYTHIVIYQSTINELYLTSILDGSENNFGRFHYVIESF